MPRAAHRTCEHSISLVVIDKLLLFGVPAQFAPECHGDIAKVTDSYGTVADFNRCSRFSMLLNTIDEVAMMIVAVLKVNLVRPNHRGL